jgi:hypothetical protein
LVSLYREEVETYSDIQQLSAPAHHWLAGEAPEYWCNPDGLHQLLDHLELPDCIYDGRVVLRNKFAPEYLDFAVPCRERACPGCHVLKYLKSTRQVSAWCRKRPIQAWYFATFPDKKNWNRFYKRQDRREPRVQYIRFPVEDRLVVLGATTKEWEDDWSPLDGQQALFNVWAAFWFTLQPRADERVTSTDGWRLPKSPRSGEFERVGITSKVGRFHERSEKYGATVDEGHSQSITYVPQNVWANAAKVADIEGTFNTGPEPTMFLSEAHPELSSDTAAPQGGEVR